MSIVMKEAGDKILASRLSNTQKLSPSSSTWGNVMRGDTLGLIGYAPDSRNGVPPVFCLTHSEKIRVSSWVALG